VKTRLEQFGELDAVQQRLVEEVAGESRLELRW